jgi:hypothetical protein
MMTTKGEATGFPLGFWHTRDECLKFTAAAGGFQDRFGPAP